jgi:hypothetical protein
MLLSVSSLWAETTFFDNPDDSFIMKSPPQQTSGGFFANIKFPQVNATALVQEIVAPRPIDPIIYVLIIVIVLLILWWIFKRRR